MMTQRNPNQSSFRKTMLVLCGPSGVGKSTLAHALLAQRENAGMSVSHTTRERRGGEEDGVDYNFVDDTKFKKMIEDGEFAEYAVVHGKHYGTSLAEIHKAWDNDINIVFDIDYQGAEQLKGQFPEAILVLIVPPSLNALKERLIKRGTDSESAIEERLSVASTELSQWPSFDYVVVNDSLEKATQDVLAIYDVANMRVSVNQLWLAKEFSPKDSAI